MQYVQYNIIGYTFFICWITDITDQSNTGGREGGGNKHFILIISQLKKYSTAHMWNQPIGKILVNRIGIENSILILIDSDITGYDVAKYSY